LIGVLKRSIGLGETATLSYKKSAAISDIQKVCGDNPLTVPIIYYTKNNIELENAIRGFSCLGWSSH